MLLTIINGDAGDDKVVLNGEVFEFSLEGMIDDGIWAFQWDGNEGQVEYRDGTQTVVKDISEFQNIYSKCVEIKTRGIALQDSLDADVKYSIGVKVAGIKLERADLLKVATSTVEVAGAVWQTDPVSVGQLNEAIALFGVIGKTPAGFEWRDADNINHLAPLPLLLEIGAARAEYVNQVWRTSWFLKAQAEACTTIKQIEAIDWPDID